MHRIYIVVRWLLGGVFIFAGGTKLVAPQTFAALIGAYGILPDILVMPAAIVLPAAEVLAGAALLGDLRGSLSAIALLLLLFMAILAYGLWMGLDVDCGCFGPDDPEAEAFHGLRGALFRDAMMMAAVVALYWWRRHRQLRPVSFKYFSESIYRSVTHGKIL
ncbi:MAG: MauE/DoxX family redox-associated membrane protein [Pseudomonadota bacterium]